MRSLWLVLALLVCSLFADAQGLKKRPIPTKEAQARIEKLLDELYKDDFLKAEKDTVLRARLAQTLLFEGKETKDDSAGRYVLFSRAQALAAQAGDVNTALQAADELASDFALPPGAIAQMKIKMLQQAAKADGAPAEAYHSVIERSLAVLDETLDADNYPASLDLIAAAESAARKLKSIVLTVSMRKKQEEIQRQQKEFARWKVHADKLAADPTDAAANSEMGRYYALIKGNWERGLPLLAKGTKSKLAALAQSDLAGPTNVGDRRIVALGWYLTATDKATDPAMRTQALLRAYHWYQENLSGADAKERGLIEGKLVEINKLLPAEHRIGEIAIELKKIDVPSGPVYGCAFSPDSKRFLATGYDNTIRVFNTRTYKEIRQLDGHAGKVWCVAYFDDGIHAVSGGFDGTVRMWDLTTGRVVKVFDGHKDYVRSVAVSEDGKWVLSGGDDRTVRLWNVSTGKEEKQFTGHDHTVWCVAFSRDGKHAVSASLDKTARVWDVAQGSVVKRLEGHTDTVLGAAFTPDGRHIITGSSDRTLRIWDLATGLTQRVLEGSTGYVLCVAVSPDGRRILSGGADNMLRLWDTQTGQQIRQLEGHRDRIWHVTFSRDGRLALSSSQDATIRVWTGAR